jgi:hypothetical protein
MESTLPAIAFAALIIAQFAAVIAVQIYIHADLLPPLSAGQIPRLTGFNGVAKEEIGHGFRKKA